MSRMYRDIAWGFGFNLSLSRVFRRFALACAAVFLYLSVALLLFNIAPAHAADQKQPALTQASTWHPGIDPRAYWVSEKLDGVRGYWNGQVLVSRTGTPIDAPDWFIAGLPDTALDGELWMGRRRFDELAGLLRRNVPADAPPDADWSEVRFMIFDLPSSPLDFDHRLLQLDTIIALADVPWLQRIEQFRVGSTDALHQELARVVALGGEGLMLHKGSALYHGVRNEDLVKLKPVYDAEARVLAWREGKGRLKGMMGSLVVETAEGVRFRLGTGFSDAERRSPPPVGSFVTYQYSGLTPAGVPRFARYLRIRENFEVAQ